MNHTRESWRMETTTRRWMRWGGKSGAVGKLMCGNKGRPAEKMLLVEAAADAACMGSADEPSSPFG